MAIYYVETDGVKDGPHDLVTIMRRIRAQKIGPDTGIFVDAAQAPIPASLVPDISVFFSKEALVEAPVAELRHQEIYSLRMNNLIRDAWRFTSENSIMTVFAGGILLLVVMVAAGMVSVMGNMIGSMLGWVLFMMMFYVFLVACLRLYRGQRFTAKFLNEQFFPVLSLLLFAGITIGLMMVGGFLLLVVPGILVAMYYAFVPLFIIDRQMSLIEAMHASRLLMFKHNGFYQWRVVMLILMLLGAIILIFPVPLALPMFGAALSKLFEELSAS